MTPAADDPRQAGLFDSPGTVTARTAWHVDAEWRAALSEAIKRSGKSREQIAGEMEERLGSDPDFPISRAMLDAFTAPSRQGWRFPVIYLDAFIEATAAEWLLDLLARKRGRLIMGHEDAEFAEVGRALVRRDQLTAFLRGWCRRKARRP